MASNNNNNNNNGTSQDWLSSTKKDLDDVSSPLGLLKEKPLSYFDALTRNYLQDSQKFQVNLGQFPQNFVVMTGPTTKVKILHSLFSVNTDPGTDTSSIIGVFGVNKVAPFKTIMATGAVQALVPPRRSSKKNEPGLHIPSSIQFSLVESAEEFKDLVGEESEDVVDELAKLPNAHFIHPQVFVDIEGKREWEASELGYKLIKLYEDDDDSDDEEDNGEGPRDVDGIHQLLVFLWASSKACGSQVTLKEIPEEGVIASFCERKAFPLIAVRPDTAGGPNLPQLNIDRQNAEAESKRLTEAMILNLTKSSEAYVRQITKDESTKSALSRLAPDQAALFNLLTADNFEVDGTPALNEFTRKLTESRDPMRSINMVRQETRLWGGSISDKSLLQFLSSGYLAPDMNQEPDGMTSFGFVPHYDRHKFEDKSNVASDNMRAMFGEKTFDEDSIKRYTKKQFYLPSRIEDWLVQLCATARFIDLLTCEEGIASEAYRTALDLYESHEQTFRSVFQLDKLMGARILYFLDRVFQEFATELSKFAGRVDPLRSAAASLRGRQRAIVIQTLGPLRYGVRPTISLPPGLVSGQQSGGDQNQGPQDGANNDDGNGGTPGGQGTPPRLKQVTLPEGWKIPDGKAFGDYFNPRLEANRANLNGWPTTTHDRTGSQKAMCVRLMVTGRCTKENCKLSHVKPATLGQANVAAITTRLALIYHG
jgi:hypothetical protein